MRIILLGAPGSGKGTQVKILTDHFKVRGISLGDILRQEVKRNSPLGGKVKEYMQEGLLVPDEIVSLVIEENINNEGFILDGYPRNVSQAEKLESILNNKNLSFDKAIYLDVSENMLITRLSGRRVCKVCNANYHVKNMPSEREGICNICGGELIQRNDDKPEVIKKRWVVFQKENASLMDYYRQRDKLVIVDANKEAEEVFQAIVKNFNYGKHSCL